MDMYLTATFGNEILVLLRQTDLRAVGKRSRNTLNKRILFTTRKQIHTHVPKETLYVFIRNASDTMGCTQEEDIERITVIVSHVKFGLVV